MSVLPLIIFGGLGVLARAWLSGAIAVRWERCRAGRDCWPWLSNALPLGTLCVNIAGAFAAGYVWRHIPYQWQILGAEARAVLVVGFLGGFTTFSSFAVESLQLLEAGQYGVAVSYVAASVICGIGAAWLGMHI